MSLSQEVSDLRKEVEKIKIFLNDGDDLVLPARSVSALAEELRDRLGKYSIIIEGLQKQINANTVAISKIDQDAVRARNQVIYMFVAIIAAIVGKVIIQVIGVHT